MALLNGNLEAGITLLKELEGQGFVRFRMLQNDPLFAPLRQHPAYQHLLESMQRRLADAWEEILLLEREK
jgi:hypothetical protein